jgi:hypothetical protein
MRAFCQRRCATQAHLVFSNARFISPIFYATAMGVFDLIVIGN